MGEITDRLVDNILEIVLEDMDCQHEVDHDEDGAHTSVEYNLKYELKVRNKIIALIEQSRKKPKVSKEFVKKEIKHFWDIVEFENKEKAMTVLVYRISSILIKAGVEVEE